MNGAFMNGNFTKETVGNVEIYNYQIAKNTNSHKMLNSR